jgi:hypothetical protein
VTETFEKPSAPQSVLGYANPPRRRRWLTFWAGVLCFYGIIVAFSFGVPMFKAAYASSNSGYPIGTDEFGHSPGSWVVQQMLGSVKGNLLILVSIALASRARRAAALAIAFCTIEIAATSLNVYSYVHDVLRIVSAPGAGRFTSNFLPSITEMLTPVVLAIAVIMLLLNLPKSE